MPKATSLWAKTFINKEGGSETRHSGQLEIEGKKYYIDMYPAYSDNPKAPSFNVYLKPATPAEEPAIPF